MHHIVYVVHSYYTKQGFHKKMLDGTVYMAEHCSEKNMTSPGSPGYSYNNNIVTTLITWVKIAMQSYN